MSEPAIYDDGNVKLEAAVENELIWLRQSDIAKIFGKERSVITRHINHILKDKEVDEKSNVQIMHIANSDKPVKFYSLDIVLAVGYRTNSAKAIQFRRWATKVLKAYLLKGYALDRERLQKEKLRELEQTIAAVYLVVLFLHKNDILYRENGEARIIDNALAALTLLVATSNPEHKEIIIRLIMNMLVDELG